MTFSQLLIRWVVVAVSVVVSRIWQGKVFDAKLLGLAMCSATALTFIAAFYPRTKLPGLLGIAVSWTRSFLIYSILMAGLAAHSPKQAIIMGFAFATLFTLTKVLW